METDDDPNLTAIDAITNTASAFVICIVVPHSGHCNTLCKCRPAFAH